jgi:predicted RNase H-like HicB family nuclease
MATKKDLKYYRGLKWSYTIEEDEHKGKTHYIVRVNELPSVVTDGETIEEAMTNIKDAIAATIKLYLEQVDPVPEPIQKEKFKGNIFIAHQGKDITTWQRLRSRSTYL